MHRGDHNLAPPNVLYYHYRISTRRSNNAAFVFGKISITFDRMRIISLQKGRSIVAGINLKIPAPIIMAISDLLREPVVRIFTFR